MDILEKVFLLRLLCVGDTLRKVNINPPSGIFKTKSLPLFPVALTIEVEADLLIFK